MPCGAVNASLALTLKAASVAGVAWMDVTSAAIIYARQSEWESTRNKEWEVKVSANCNGHLLIVPVAVLSGRGVGEWCARWE